MSRRISRICADEDDVLAHVVDRRPASLSWTARDRAHVQWNRSVPWPAEWAGAEQVEVPVEARRDLVGLNPRARGESRRKGAPDRAQSDPEDPEMVNYDPFDDDPGDAQDDLEAAPPQHADAL
jgi:hypothetical protein